MVSFDEFINTFNIKHIETDDKSLALNEFIEKKYDILSYNGSLELKPGDSLLFIRDFVSNIQSYVPIYYVIDDKEYLIMPSTKILKFLSPLKPIFLRNKTNEVQHINFKKWLVKLEIIDKLSHITVRDSGILYYYGEAHNIIHDT